MQTTAKPGFQIPPLIDFLQLFRSLIKDGAIWQGDVTGSRWAEYLAVPESSQEAVNRTLAQYEEGVAYKRDAGGVWLA